MPTRICQTCKTSYFFGWSLRHQPQEHIDIFGRLDLTICRNCFNVYFPEPLFAVVESEATN